MAELTLKFELVCADCERDLDHEVVTDYLGNQTLKVKPCKDCREAAEEEAAQRMQEGLGHG